MLDSKKQSKTSQGDEGPQPQPGTFEELSLAPVHTIDISEWPAMASVITELKALDLLGEEFVYTALKSDKVNQIHRQGSYVTDETGAPMIFGCTYRKIDNEWTIAQANDDTADLWSYMQTNTDVIEDFATIAVYDMKQLRHHCMAEFMFQNPEQREKALIALVHVEGF